MNKNILIVVSALLSQLTFGATPSIGRISDVLGSGFISQNGETHELKKGTLVFPNSEIVVEHNGQVTYTDNADHRYYLGNSSALAVTAKGVELRSGDIWFQSQNKSEKMKVTTANSIVEFDGGEGIITYDSSKGKTQLMVINGLMKISNLRTPDLNLSVSEGNFSYVDNSYDEGAPRDPTPVGQKTYQALIEEFKGVSPLDKNSEKIFTANDSHQKESHHKNEHEASREIASVKEEVSHEPVHAKAHESNHESKAKVENHNPKSADPMLEEYKNSMFEKKSKVTLKKTEKKVYAKPTHSVAVKVDKEASPLVVHVFGQKNATSSNFVSATKPESTPSARKPASMSAPVEAVVEKTTPVRTEQKIENTDDSNKQVKPFVRSKETENLIEEIKNL